MKNFFLILLIAGCSHTSQKTIVGPDGTKHKLITCNEVEDCYQKANELCGEYKIVNSSTNTSGVENITSSEIQLLVKCEEK